MWSPAVISSSSVLRPRRRPPRRKLVARRDFFVVIHPRLKRWLDAGRKTFVGHGRRGIVICSTAEGGVFEGVVGEGL